MEFLISKILSECTVQRSWMEVLISKILNFQSSNHKTCSLQNINSFSLDGQITLDKLTMNQQNIYWRVGGYNFKGYCISFSDDQFCLSKQCGPWLNAILCGISFGDFPVCKSTHLWVPSPETFKESSCTWNKYHECSYKNTSMKSKFLPC